MRTNAAPFVTRAVSTFIPAERPVTPLLDAIEKPADLRRLPRTSLVTLAEELRLFLLWTVGRTGGHFGAGLGVVELTVALHYVFDTPEDKLVWDVGHQTYPHKILCGRRGQMESIRKRHGLAPFPCRTESEYDAFGTGHSSTSVSAALGMERAAFHLSNRQRRHVAIIGDGAMTAGMAFEALNHAGAMKSDLLVVLNDNAMSISDNVGALSQFFSKFIAGKTYMTLKQFFKEGFKGLPFVHELMHQTEEGIKHLFLPPSSFFETLGFNYTGILDGHNLPELTEVLERLKETSGPQLLHIKTRKGKGYAPAEQDPIGYHALTKIVPVNTKAAKSEKNDPKPLTYSQVFGRWICDMAEKDPLLVAITPAMCEGSGLVEFARSFPDRYYDVGICEQHALTLAAGLACGGMRPVVAIYSTFLQRGYDQLIHDICLQNLPVLLAIDRAGLVGEDGPTHNGAYDLSYLACIPNMTIMTPSDENLTYRMLTSGYKAAAGEAEAAGAGRAGPVAVRYPRGAATGAALMRDERPVIGGAILREGKKDKKHKPALLVFGAPMSEARKLAEKYDWTLADMCLVKPLDIKLIDRLLVGHTRLVTVEENVINGGAGSLVAGYLAGIRSSADLLMLGIDDRFVAHATQSQMRSSCGLDAAGLEKRIRKHWQDLA